MLKLRLTVSVSRTITEQPVFLSEDLHAQTMGLVRDKVASAAVVGYTRPVGGLQVRPALVKGLDALNMLQAKLMGTTCTKRNLDFVVPLPAISPPIYPSDVADVTLIQAHRNRNRYLRAGWASSCPHLQMLDSTYDRWWNLLHYDLALSLDYHGLELLLLPVVILHCS